MGLLSEGGANAARGGKTAVLLFTVLRYFVSVTCAFSTISKKLELNTFFFKGGFDIINTTATDSLVTEST